jgi:predicted xylose isomerase-like sugar epimerase
MKVIAAESLDCKLLICDNDQVYLGMLGDMGYRQYYSLEPLSSDLIWVEGEQLELDLALNNYIEGEL